MSKFILLVDIQATRESEGMVWYCLQEIQYEHFNCIEAVDAEAAVDYCDKVLNIDPNCIV